MKVLLRKNSTANYAEVKLDDRQDVQLNFTHDNLENPTVYVSECSYSLKLPRCAENDKFFSQFCQLDSVVLVNGYDPTRRMDYMLLDSTGAIISTGSAVINTIDGQNYNLSLLGSQSRIFKRLLNAGYDTMKAAEDDTYYLMDDRLRYERIYSQGLGRFTPQDNGITDELVYTSWMIDQPIFNISQITIRHLRLCAAYGLLSDEHVTETMAYMCSIIGLAPTSQGRYKDFESDTWLEKGTINGSPAAKPSFLPVLCSTRNIDGEPINMVEVKDGTIDAQMLEYRSYYMQPYIYISALWQLFAAEFSNITNGYTLSLDTRWFNSENTELIRLVYMLPPLATDIGGHIGSIPEDTGHFPYLKYMPQMYDIIDQTDYPVGGTVGGQVPGLSTLNLTCTSSDIVIERTHLNKIRVVANVDMQLNGKSGKTMYYNGFNPLLYTITLRDNSNNVLVSEEVLIFMLPSDNAVDFNTLTDFMYVDNIIRNRVHSNGDKLMTVIYDPVVGSSTFHFTIDMEVGITPAEDVTLNVEALLTFENNCAPYMYLEDGVQHYWYNGQLPTQSVGGTLTFGGAIEVAARSNSTISLERLFSAEAPFNVLMKFCKLHHLLWVVDDTAKTVSVVRASDYYADRYAEGISNITDTVDMSKEITMSPLSWESHRIIFNLSDPNVTGVEGYKERYGQGYGSKVVVTKNNLNKNDKELLKDIVSSVMYGQTVAPCGQLRLVTDEKTVQHTELNPQIANVSNGESAAVFGNFYYRHNNTQLEAVVMTGWRVAAYITDDHQMETRDGRYCWHGIDVIEGVQCNVLPVFNTVSDGGLSVLFAPVREQYTQQPDEPSTYLYEHCWKNYIEEVYNAQNKTVELYINISPSMLAILRRNPLVQIENCIYLLTEIKGWGEHSQKCKCKLRQITNINKLTQ